MVLARPEGPANVGSVARLCGNFGVGLHLVAPIADVDGPEAMRMAHPCQELLAAAPRYAQLEEAIREHSMVVGTSGKIAQALAGPTLDVTQAGRLLPAAPERLALVFGNERTGLSHREAAACPRLLRLATPGPVGSLNLASAVAVALTLFAAASGAGVEPRAPAAAWVRFLSGLEDRLAAAQFYRRGAAEAFRPRLQELLGKMDLSERDLELWNELMNVLGASGRRDPGSKT